MKFQIENKTKDSIYNLLRQARYRPHADAYVRPLGSNFYPRFHLYVRDNTSSSIVDMSLHIDQRKPRYQGTTAHNADYDGDVLVEESNRIKNIFENV